MPIRNKRIFITGGAGFIGSTLANELADSNQVIIYDNFDRDTLQFTELREHPNVKVIEGDILDVNLLTESMEDSDIVVHAAAIAGIDTVVISPINTMKVNIIGTANVLETAVKVGVKDRVLDFSTSEVFGSHAFNSTENDNAVTGSVGEARWVYSISKLAGEHLSNAFFKEYALPVTTVRPFNIYGPGQTGEGAIHKFIKQALKDEDITIHGDGSQIRAWCYVDDMVDALLLCLEHPDAVGESFNIGNQRAVITIYGLAQTVCRILKSSSRMVFSPLLSADIELRIPNVDKAHKILGYKAKVDLEEGILRTAEWYRNLYAAYPIKQIAGLTLQ